MDVREALYTTRAMRRVRPDPIPYDVQARIMDAAIRAPSGGNTQTWRFILVDDPATKAVLGPYYRRGLEHLWATIYKERMSAADANPEDPASVQALKIRRSADHLGQNFESIPLFLFAFTRNDNTGGSIFPAVWNAMLAARAEGVGTSLTSVLSLHQEAVFEALGVPTGKGWENACCVSFGYPTGRWGVAQRRPVHEVAHRNRWDAPLGFEVPEPLWPDA